MLSFRGLRDVISSGGTLLGAHQETQSKAVEPAILERASAVLCSHSQHSVLQYSQGRVRYSGDKRDSTSKAIREAS